MIRRVFTLIHVALITALAFQGVSLFYGVVARKIDRVRDFRPAASVKVAPEIRSGNPLSHYRAIVDRNVFKLASPEAVAPTAESKAENTDEIESTDLQLKLWGTVIGDEENSHAVIEDQKKRTQELYAVGDAIPNTRAVIRRILNKTVILQVDGKDQKLEMQEASASMSSPGTALSGRVAPPSMGARDIASLPPQNIHLARSQIQDALADINNLMQQVNIRPHFEEGKPAGLMLSRIQPNSIFRRMGLRNGDVITGVDGQRIESVDDALKFYDNLKDSNDVSLEIRRSGQSRNIQYQIRD